MTGEGMALHISLACVTADGTVAMLPWQHSLHGWARHSITCTPSGNIVYCILSEACQSTIGYYALVPCLGQQQSQQAVCTAAVAWQGDERHQLHAGTTHLEGRG